MIGRTRLVLGSVVRTGQGKRTFQNVTPHCRNDVIEDADRADFQNRDGLVKMRKVDRRPRGERAWGPYPHLWLKIVSLVTPFVKEKRKKEMNKRKKE